MDINVVSADAITPDDIKALRVCAAQLKYLSGKLYGEQGIEADRMRADKAAEVADKLERRLHA